MEFHAAILISIALTNLCAASLKNVTDVNLPLNFRQKLDHFEPDNQEHFDQRYYVFDTYFRKGSPIMLYLGGEGELQGIFQTFPLEIAIKFNGMVIAIEHRYYGKSLPASYSGGIPRYLSVEQALADYAYFIETQKERFPLSPWIVCGCSYAGNLATWMRLKYPHLVVGAIAGSAPLLATADNYEYLEVVGEVLKKRAPLCHQKIVEANEELTTLAKTWDGRKKLARMFRAGWYSPRHGYKFHYYLAKAVLINGDFQYLPYFQPYASEVCNSVTGNTHGKSALEVLLNFLLPSQTNRSQESIPRNATIIGPQLTGLNKYLWGYQICYQFGNFVTLSSSSKKQIFGVWANLFEVFWAYCYRWNTTLETLEENINKTNLQYGGKNPNVTNVVFLHGSNDPWHPLGVISDLSISVRAFMFQGLSHCEIFRGREYFKVADGRIPGWMKMFDEIESIVRSWFKSKLEK